MGIFKKLFPDETQPDDEVSALAGYQTEGEEDDGRKPRPQFVLAKPERRDDLIDIANDLLDRKTVILNLELVINDTRRFVDFLSGVAYALNGQVKKVAVHTFLIIPGGLDITGSIFEDIESEINF